MAGIVPHTEFIRIVEYGPIEMGREVVRRVAGVWTRCQHRLRAYGPACSSAGTPACARAATHRLQPEKGSSYLVSHSIAGESAGIDGRLPVGKQNIKNMIRVMYRSTRCKSKYLICHNPESPFKKRPLLHDKKILHLSRRKALYLSQTSSFR